MIEGASDPRLYDYAPYSGRPKIEWPDGKKVAVWVAPNLEYYEIDPPANPMRKSWPRPHHDVLADGVQWGWDETDRIAELYGDAIAAFENRYTDTAF